jgi:HK97 family phage portal protein
MSIYSKLKQFFNLPVARPEKVSHKPFYIPMANAGVRVDTDSALRVSTVWAAVRIISESVAGLPWRAYIRAANGDAVMQPMHPVTSVLHRWPNPEMTAFTFRETMMGWVLLWGNAYAEIERDMAGRISALWPIAPDRVEPRRNDETGAIEYVITQYAGGPVIIPAANMFHLHGLGFDGITGYSVVAYAAKSLGISLASEEFGASFFANGSTVHGVLKHPGRLSPEAKTLLSESWRNQHQGPSRAWRPVVLEEGMAWENIGLPPGDSQFLETRQFQVNDIARWFRVPPHKLGDLTKTSYASQEHASIEFVTEALVPWCQRLEQEADRKLFGQTSSGNLYTKISVNALLRGDMAGRSAFYREMYYLGVLSINEIRQFEDMNSIGEDGDARFVQANMVPLDRALEEPEPVTETAPADETMPMEDEDMGEDMSNYASRKDVIASLHGEHYE